jgi:hypothetical protein
MTFSKIKAILIVQAILTFMIGAMIANYGVHDAAISGNSVSSPDINNDDYSQRGVNLAGNYIIFISVIELLIVFVLLFI